MAVVLRFALLPYLFLHAFSAICIENRVMNPSGTLLCLLLEYTAFVQLTLAYNETSWSVKSRMATISFQGPSGTEQHDGVT